MDSDEGERFVNLLFGAAQAAVTELCENERNGCTRWSPEHRHNVGMMMATASWQVLGAAMGSYAEGLSVP